MASKLEIARKIFYVERPDGLGSAAFKQYFEEAWKVTYWVLWLHSVPVSVSVVFHLIWLWLGSAELAGTICYILFFA